MSRGRTDDTSRKHDGGEDTPVDSIARIPIFFAQVREDPLVEEAVISRYFADTRNISVAMVASGGDTAAYILGDRRVRRLDLVDVSRAQLALSRLKIGLLEEPRERRLALLGHTAMCGDARRQALENILKRLGMGTDVFGEVDIGLGIDHAGRYEMMFEDVRRRLHNHMDEIEELFTLSTAEEQVQRVAPDTALGKALDVAFERTMSLENLERVFGPKAVGNRVQPFDRHFVERIRAYMAEHPVFQSPFMAQILLGRFYMDMCYPWHNLPHCTLQTDVTFHEMEMTRYLRTARGLDVIHLSNITDWLSQDEVKELLSLAADALSPGGVVVIRQLNTGFDLCTVCCGLFWDANAADELHAADRSFLYRRLAVGRKVETSLERMHAARLANNILERHPVTGATFFRDLAAKKVSHSAFLSVQARFFHAVDYFWRPMSVLLSRLESYDHRHALLQNVLEEHGEGNPREAHTETFKLFLARLGCAPPKRVHPGVLSFNMSLMGVAAAGDVHTALGCFGLIEHSFSKISALTGGYVAEMGWLSPDDIVHYSLHAELDKEHARGLFAASEPALHDRKQLASFEDGLRLGAHIFRALYDSIYII